jgi:hypothetical protein
MSNRFDQKPGEKFGTCLTCKIDLLTEEDSKNHVNETIKASPDHRSHSYVVLNPSREEKIKRAVSSIIDSAIQDALEDVDDLVYRNDATEEEITKALRFYDNFSEYWEDNFLGQDR